MEHELAPAEYSDPVVEAYKKDVDRTLLRENLKLKVEERFVKFGHFWKYAQALREAGRKGRDGVSVPVSAIPLEGSQGLLKRSSPFSLIGS